MHQSQRMPLLHDSDQCHPQPTCTGSCAGMARSIGEPPASCSQAAEPRPSSLISCCRVVHCTPRLVTPWPRKQIVALLRVGRDPSVDLCSHVNGHIGAARPPARGPMLHFAGSRDGDCQQELLRTLGDTSVVRMMGCKCAFSHHRDAFFMWTFASQCASKCDTFL